MIPPDILEDLELLSQLLQDIAQEIKSPTNDADDLAESVLALKICARTLDIHRRRVVFDQRDQPHRPNHRSP